MSNDVIEQHLSAGRLGQAESVARHALSLDPTDVSAQVALARIAAAYGDVDDAIAQLQEIVSQDPRAAEALAFLGVILHQQGDAEQAAMYAKRAADLGSDIPANDVLLGDLDLDAGDLQSALQHYDRALSMNEELSAAWYGRGRALKRMEELADAEDALAFAVQYGPERVDAWLELITLEADAGAEDAALENLTLALRAHPGHPDLVTLKNSYAERGDGDEVERLLEQIRARLHIHDYEAAARMVDEMLESFEGDPRCLLAQGELLIAEDAGDMVGTIHALSRYVREDQNTWEHRTVLGRLFLRATPLQNPRLAVAHCEDAWRISGEHPRAGIGLVEAWSAVQKTAFALALCERLAKGDGPEADLARQMLALDEEEEA